MALSKTQLDKVGDRLRASDEPTAEDRAAYDEYRTSHGDALEHVGSRILDATNLVPSGRVKTIESTIAKLKRQRIRLSQIADIAGARLIVRDTGHQATVVGAVEGLFGHGVLKDYRLEPQNGYRAVHVVVTSEEGLPVEVQVRTPAQNVWANLCEDAAAGFGIDVKYGGGPSELQSILTELSDMVAAHDLGVLQSPTLAERLPGTRTGLADLALSHDLSAESAHRLLTRFHDLGLILAMGTNS